MAGEIEDDIIFQAEPLPNGSISLGRFEAESLSWERNSSFSHNRYLEEVEKYSTPGSVTKKKAYFEAHFKRKPLLCPASLETQNAIESPSIENQNEDHISYMKECASPHNTGKQQFDWSDETPALLCEHHHDVLESGGHVQFEWYDDGSFVSDEQDHDEIEETGHKLQFDWYDETPTGSEEHENNVFDYEQEETSPSEYLMETNPISEHMVLDVFAELAVRSKNIQLLSGDDCMPLQKEESCEAAEKKPESGSVDSHVVVEQKPEGVAETEADGELSGKSGIQVNSSVVEKDNAANLKKAVQTSLKVKATKQKTVEKQSVMMPPAQPPRNKLNGKGSVSSVKSIKISRTMESNNILGRKPEKQSALRALSTIPGKKDFRAENSESLKAKGMEERKSNKGLPSKKLDFFQPISGKQDVCGRQSASRPKALLSSSTRDRKQSSTGFSFRSHERAEKRKEFYMKLEERLHAKEVQMNEIQAKTQEETEAEIKQFRRSLNFKATPMPSFYHEVAPGVFNGKKMISSQAKHPPTRHKCTTPGSRTTRLETLQASTSSMKPNGELRDSIDQESRFTKETEKKDEKARLPVRQQRENRKASKSERSRVGKVMKETNVAVHVAS